MGEGNDSRRRSFRPDTHPVHLAVYVVAARFSPDPAYTDNGIIFVGAHPTHAIVDSETTSHIWVARVRSLVAEYSHIALSDGE